MVLSDLEDGSSIFVDANIFVYHFTRESKANPASSDFLERIERGTIHGFTSVSIVQEVTRRMMIIEAVAVLPGVKPKDLVKYLKTHSDAVKKLVNHQSIPCIPSKIASRKSGDRISWHRRHKRG
jgi:predicted nucleic acid-binding protein